MINVKITSRIISFFLILAVVFSIAVIPASAISYSMYNTNGDKTVAELQNLFPDGTYFNGPTVNGISTFSFSPCSHAHGHCSYSGSCGCGTFKGLCIQCMGFGYALQYYAFSGFNGYSNAVTIRNYSEAMAKLKPGDVIRANSHTMFVVKVEGNIITIAEANRDGHCKIQWGRQITKESLRSGFSYVDQAPRALKNSSAISTGSGHTMRVIARSGLNMRYGPSTSNAVMKAIPYGYYVTAYESTNGFTRVSWNGYTGWCSSQYLS